KSEFSGHRRWGGFFIVGMGEGQFVAGGAEVGLICFGQPFRRIWGFYSSLGLGTLKAALGVGATLYGITSSGKTRDVVHGATNLDKVQGVDDDYPPMSL